MLALIVLIKSVWIMIILFILIGFIGGLIYLSSLDLLIINEKESKGAKAGLFESAIGLGSVLSPILAGLLGNIISYLPFIVFSIVTLIIWCIIRKY
jgi:MFS family permease